MAPKKRKGKAGRRAGARPDDVMTDRREKRRLKKLAKKKKKAKRGRKSRLRDLKNIPLGGGDGALDVPVMRYSTSDGAGKVEDASPLPDCGADGTGDELLHGHLDINPENVKRSAYVIDVTCGDNEAILFMKGLSTGSKGACVLFEQNWLTPNEFQYVSGRESAKDWKRSIKHHGKSLKILVSRGLMCLKQRRCKCYTCEGRVKDDDGRISPDRADKQLSGSSSHGQDLSKSATSECQDTAESARTGSVDVTENKVQHCVREIRKNTVAKFIWISSYPEYRLIVLLRKI
ncbi:hypothetical protein LSH36_302g05030 [Paralvinella palmiformis]|uniref:SAND domain-containing protein n=1 Tax=Paralvinella palmiformis TaxID=53620 RepID=A0AAD9N137_9ANNE|nr:hypothetical protein LSH36_302g05030 [Paralvinella palmiformis]